MVARPRARRQIRMSAGGSGRSVVAPIRANLPWRWTRSVGEGRGGGVLLVDDRLELVHDVVLIVAFVDREVGHESVGSCTVPVLLVGLEEDAVPGADDLDRPFAALAQTYALGDEDGLAERVAVPVGAGAGHEVHQLAVRRDGGGAAATASM